MVKYNFSDGFMVVDGVSYPFGDYQIWLLQNHEQLCIGHFVKAIHSGGRTIFTYDWQTIYLKSEEYQFLNDYINEINSTSSK